MQRHARRLGDELHPERGERPAAGDSAVGAGDGRVVGERGAQPSELRRDARADEDVHDAEELDEVSLRPQPRHVLLREERQGEDEVHDAPRRRVEKRRRVPEQVQRHAARALDAQLDEEEEDGGQAQVEVEHQPRERQHGEGRPHRMERRRDERGTHEARVAAEVVQVGRRGAEPFGKGDRVSRRPVGKLLEPAADVAVVPVEEAGLSQEPSPIRVDLEEGCLQLHLAEARAEVGKEPARRGMRHPVSEALGRGARAVGAHQRGRALDRPPHLLAARQQRQEYGR